jgi:hypothetical protein
MRRHWQGDVNRRIGDGRRVKEILQYEGKGSFILSRPRKRQMHMKQFRTLANQISKLVVLEEKVCDSRNKQLLRLVSLHERSSF